MTLLTCTPYMINSHRLLVRGHRVEYTPPIQEARLPLGDFDNYRALALLAGLVILALAFTAARTYRDYREARKKLEEVGHED